MKQSNLIKKAIRKTGKLYNYTLDIKVTDRDRRRISDKINELQELLYSYLYIDKHGMI